MAKGFIPCAGYPGTGARAIRIEATGDLVGNNNYQVGGYNLTATQFGLSGFESVGVSARTYSLNYYAQILYNNNSANNAELQAPVFQTALVKWYYAANSVEVANNTDLSAEICRVTAIGI